MRLSPATRLSTRSLEWVAYRNDGTSFNRITAPVSHSATIWSETFSQAHATGHRCPVSGWVSQQG